jgi:homoserine kinase
MRLGRVELLPQAKGEEMAPRQVIVRAPATTANLGPGFDSLGMALDLWVEVAISTGPAPAGFSPDPAEEMATDAARRLYARAGVEVGDGVWAQYRARIPVARGLGASAACRAAGLLGANALLGEPLDREAVLVLGTGLEGHPDNMAAVLFGGLQVVVLDGEAVVHAGLPAPADLKAVLFVPDFEMPTDESRRALPTQLSREDAVHNIGRAALLVAALAGDRPELLDVATHDRIHQPARAKIFPAMEPVFQAARRAGALAVFLSGGGSTILALASRDEDAIGRAMAEAAATEGVAGETIVTRPSDQGAQVVLTD